MHANKIIAMPEYEYGHATSSAKSRRCTMETSFKSTPTEIRPQFMRMSSISVMSFSSRPTLERKTRSLVGIPNEATSRNPLARKASIRAMSGKSFARKGRLLFDKEEAMEELPDSSSVGAKFILAIHSCREKTSFKFNMSKREWSLLIQEELDVSPLQER